MQKLPISAFVVCCDEEQHIGDCLKSLDFCEEVIVVDSYSKDATPAIAREMGAKVIEREWPGYKAQKEFALTQVKNEWVINLDADERVSPELQENIAKVMSGEIDSTGLSGFEINRVVYYLDRWWRKGGWYPEYRLRFFRKSQVVWGGVDPHEKPIPESSVGRLDGEIEHYTYADMQAQFYQLLKFAKIAAKQDFEKGKKIRLRHLIVNPVIRFFRFFILKQGFREGVAGFIIAIAEANYTFLKYAYLWEMWFNSKKAQDKREGHS